MVPGLRRSLRVIPAVVAMFAAQGVCAREIGIDVSQFQGTINWTQVKSSGQTFAFIRATRGGQTSAGATDSVDDTAFATNIVNAKAAGLLVSPYHFARPDVLLGGSITQDAQDEAHHFMSIAGNYMVKGYLRPVLDVEAGSGTSAAQLSQWVNTFCSTIVAAKGAAADPIVYSNTSYAYNEMDTSVTGHALWLARYNSTAVNPQTDIPQTPSGFNNAYGVWNQPSPTGPPQNPGPWSFWQYTSQGACPGIDPAVNTVDLDVFHSETASITSFVVPEPTSGVVVIAAAMLAIRRNRHA